MNLLEKRLKNPICCSHLNTSRKHFYLTYHPYCRLRNSAHTGPNMLILLLRSVALLVRKCEVSRKGNFIVRPDLVTRFSCKEKVRQAHSHMVRHAITTNTQEQDKISDLVDHTPSVFCFSFACAGPDGSLQSPPMHGSSKVITRGIWTRDFRAVKY